MFLAGIDGGGTHTRLELRDSENRLIRRERFGPFNLNSIGEAAFRALLRQVFDACGGMETCAKLCIGGAGCVNPKMKEILAQELENAGFRGKWRLCGDEEIALRGALDGPGAVLICGTGSICFGRNERGETASSGGHGHLIDDGGSGYAIAREVLSAAVKASDGRGGSPALLEAVKRTLHVSTVEEIVSYVYDNASDKSVITPLCFLALEQAQKGDSVSMDILHQGAEELTAMVRAVQNRLEMPRCPVAILGGLGGEENLYREILETRLSPIAQPVCPIHDALWGAAQMAWEL